MIEVKQGLPTPPTPYVEPYQTISLIVNEVSGNINFTTILDTSSGVFTPSFNTIATGEYDLTLTGWTTLLVGIFSSCESTATASPNIVVFYKSFANVFKFFVLDHNTGNLVSNWERLNITIFVK